MNKLFKYILTAIVAVGSVALTSCSPEDFPSVNAGGVPSASDFESAIEILVDQETNQVTFNLNASGHYPIWIFDGKTYSTENGLQKIFTVAGDYTVEIKVANANGISDGTIVKTFTLNETKFDFSKYYTFINGGASKQWYVASKEKGHLACGELGTTGDNWWSAAPEEKADFGVYDDVLTFSADNQYTYNPGDGGTMYVNVGCSIFPEYNTTGADFMVPVSEQTVNYSFDVEGADLYLTFPPQTLLPYIPHDAFFANPRYRVESMNGKKMVLIADIPEGGISWRLILTTEKEEVFEGFKYNSEFNMWKQATSREIFQYYAPGWSQLANPEVTVAEDFSSYSFNLPTATDQQWQAQFHITTDLATTAASNYDVSMIITSSKDIAGATVKLTAGNDDNIFYFADQIALTAGTEYIFYKSNMPGIDMTDVKFVFDFGGNPDNTDIEIRNIVLKDHANDDGTKLPDEGGEETTPDVAWVDYASADNLWYNVNIAQTTFWWADAGWAQTADPTYSEITNGFNLVVDAGYTGTSQWQGQMAFETADLVLTAGQLYDISITICPTNDIAGVTTKLCAVGLDANGDGDKDDEGDINGDSTDYMLFETRTDCPAMEETVIKHIGVTSVNDVNPAKLVFDFGGAPAGTEIAVTNIIIQRHAE